MQKFSYERIPKRIYDFNYCFPKPNQRYNEERKNIIKENEYTQQKYPNQTFNEDKNEYDKKVFRQMLTKIYFKSISNLRNVKKFKTLIKSKTFYQSSTQI
jgi:hypothetical protein